MGSMEGGPELPREVRDFEGEAFESEAGAADGWSGSGYDGVLAEESAYGGEDIPDSLPASYTNEAPAPSADQSPRGSDERSSLYEVGGPRDIEELTARIMSYGQRMFERRRISPERRAEPEAGMPPEDVN